MRKYIIFLIPIIVLDLLAIHDIILGAEPDYSQEYTALVFSAIIFALVIFRYIYTKRLNSVECKKPADG